MKLLVCGAAGFIGSTFVELRPARARRRRPPCSTPSPTRAAGRTCARWSPRHPLRRRGDRGSPRRWPTAIGDAEAIVNFAAETHVDRSIADPFAFSVTKMARAPTCCWKPLANAACATCRCPLTRSTGRSRRGRSPRHRRCSPPAPTAPPRPAPTSSSSAITTPTGSRRFVCRGPNNYGPRQYPEKLIPLMILNAMAGDHLPVYGDGKQRPQLALRGGLRPRHRPRPRPRQAGEVYNCGGPDECENIEAVKRHPAAPPAPTTR